MQKRYTRRRQQGKEHGQAHQHDLPSKHDIGVGWEERGCLEEQGCFVWSKRVGGYTVYGIYIILLLKY